MAKRIQENNTVVEYINVAIEYTSLVMREKLTAISLDTEEWVQLLNLIDSNYKDSATLFVKNLENNHQLFYGDITIFYSGTSTKDGDYDYRYFLDMYKHDIATHRAQLDREQQNPQEYTAQAAVGQAAVGTIRTGTTNTIRFNQFTPAEWITPNVVRENTVHRVTF